MGGIEQFENKLRNTGITPYVANEEDSDEEVREMAKTAGSYAKGLTGFSGNSKKTALLGGMTMGGVGGKHIEKRVITERARKDRERRRRK